jgi:hypothetical protein
MKQLTLYKPTFSTANNTLDFSTLPNFKFSKLYAVINTTQNVPLYIAGAPNLGATNPGNGPLVTLSVNTTTYNPSDNLNIYYDDLDGFDSFSQYNVRYSNLKIIELLEQLLIETKVTNLILSEGFDGSPFVTEVAQLRKDINSNVTDEG